MYTHFFTERFDLAFCKLFALVKLFNPLVELLDVDSTPTAAIDGLINFRVVVGIGGGGGRCWRRCGDARLHGGPSLARSQISRRVFFYCPTTTRRMMTLVCVVAMEQKLEKKERGYELKE